jgi:ankyrin repeat protein
MNIHIKVGIAFLCLMPVSTHAMSAFLTLLGVARSALIRTVEKDNDIVLKKDDEKPRPNLFLSILDNIFPYLTFGYYQSLREKFEKAVEEKNFNKIKEIYDNAKKNGIQLNLNEPIVWDRPPLIYVLHYNLDVKVGLDTIKFFIENGASPTKPSTIRSEDITPLEAAVEHGDLKIVQYLLTHKSVQNSITEEKIISSRHNPICIAFSNISDCKKKSSPGYRDARETCSLLIQNGATCSFKNFDDFIFFCLL